MPWVLESGERMQEILCFRLRWGKVSKGHIFQLFLTTEYTLTVIGWLIAIIIRRITIIIREPRGWGVRQWD